MAAQVPTTQAADGLPNPTEAPVGSTSVSAVPESSSDTQAEGSVTEQGTEPSGANPGTNFGLSHEQLNVCIQMFNRLNQVFDQVLTTEEQRTSGGKVGESISSAELDMTLKALDPKGTGSVTLESFIAMYAERLKTPIEASTTLRCSWPAGVMFYTEPEWSSVSDIMLLEGQHVVVLERVEDWVRADRGWLPLYHVSTGFFLFEAVNVDEITFLKQKLGLSDDQVLQYKAAFDLFQKNDEGKIDARNMKTLLEQVGEDSSEDQIRAMIADIDAGKDGTVSLEEFFTMMSRRTKTTVVAGATIQCHWPAGVRYRRTQNRQDLLTRRIDEGATVMVEERSADWVRTANGWLPLYHVATGKLLFEVVKVEELLIHQPGVSYEKLTEGLIPGVRILCTKPGGMRYKERSNAGSLESGTRIQEGDKVVVLERSDLWVRAEKGWLLLVHLPTGTLNFQLAAGESSTSEDEDDDDDDDAVAEQPPVEEKVSPVVRIDMSLKNMPNTFLIDRQPLRADVERSVQVAVLKRSGVGLVRSDVSVQIRPGTAGSWISAIIRCADVDKAASVKASLESMLPQVCSEVADQVQRIRMAAAIEEPVVTDMGTVSLRTLVDDSPLDKRLAKELAALANQDVMLMQKFADNEGFSAPAASVTVTSASITSPAADKPVDTQEELSDFAAYVQASTSATTSPLTFKPAIMQVNEQFSIAATPELPAAHKPADLQDTRQLSTLTTNFQASTSATNLPNRCSRSEDRISSLEAALASAQRHAVMEATELRNAREECTQISAGWSDRAAAIVANKTFLELKQARALRKEAETTMAQLRQCMEEASIPEAEVVKLRCHQVDKASVKGVESATSGRQVLERIDPGVNDDIAATVKGGLQDGEVTQLRARLDEEIRHTTALKRENDSLKQELRALSRLAARR
eukprot:TRINITY_DN4472_c1_g1_i2.p1 TRINITY_DN4472_c1_g1~~TRINITY_DN4472_c1_g1_i2.p1  ORF type:complete len:979 (+),score=163.61 TRINITY_DN4472_c1_g1_i2:185-2938(+)